MFFYAVFFGLVALVAMLILGHPVYVSAGYTDFFAGLTGTAAMPLWPLLFVTIACGSISGWHSLVSSSATSKQIQNERDVAPVTAGSMLAEGVLALIALSIVATLSAADTKGLSAANIFTKGAASLLGGSAEAGAYVGLIFIALALAVMMLVVRLGRVTINEIGGERIPLLRNKYIASIIFLAVTFILASPSFGGTWIYIWVLFGGSNQLMAGLALMIITLWLLDAKKGWMLSGIPGVFMIVTTIAALGFASYQSLTKGFSTPVSPGNIVAGFIGVILIIAALIMCSDIFMAFRRRKKNIQAPQT
jgi:carbon starvation protein